MSHKPAPLPLTGVKIFMQIRPMPVVRTPGGFSPSPSAHVPSKCSEMLLNRELVGRHAAGRTHTLGLYSSPVAYDRSLFNVSDGEVSVHGDRVKHNAKKDIFRLGAKLVLSESGADVVVFYNGSCSFLENVLVEGKIPVVSPAWLMACRESATRVPTRDYQITLVGHPCPPSPLRMQVQFQDELDVTRATSGTSTSLHSNKNESAPAEEDDDLSRKTTHRGLSEDREFAMSVALQESLSQQLYRDLTADGDEETSSDEGDETTDPSSSCSSASTEGSKQRKPTSMVYCGSTKHRNISSKKRLTRTTVTSSQSLLRSDSYLLPAFGQPTATSSQPLDGNPELNLAAPFFNPEEDSQPQFVENLLECAEYPDYRTTPNALVSAVVEATHRRFMSGASPPPSATKERHRSPEQSIFSPVADSRVVSNHKPLLISDELQPSSEAVPSTQPLSGHASSATALLTNNSGSVVNSQTLRSDIVFSKAIIEAQQRQLEHRARLERDEEITKSKRGVGGRVSASVTPVLAHSRGRSVLDAEEEDTGALQPKQLFAEEDSTATLHAVKVMKPPLSGPKSVTSGCPSTSVKKRMPTRNDDSETEAKAPAIPSTPTPIYLACPAPSLCSISGVGDSRATIQSIVEFMGCEVATKVFGKRTVAKPTHMVLVGPPQDAPLGTKSVAITSSPSVVQARDGGAAETHATSGSGAASINPYLVLASVVHSKFPPTLAMNPHPDFNAPQAFYPSAPCWCHALPSATYIRDLLSLHHAASTSLRRLPSSVTSVVSSRVMLALASGIPLLNDKWVFDSMDIVPQAIAASASPTMPSPSQSSTDPGKRKSKLKKGAAGSEGLNAEDSSAASGAAAKFTLAGDDSSHVQEHGATFDGHVLCDDWSCFCCSDIESPPESDESSGESGNMDCTPKRRGVRKSLRKGAITRGAFLSYLGYPPSSSSLTSPLGDKQTAPYPRSLISELGNVIQDLIPSGEPTQRVSVFIKFALLQLLPVEHATYVHVAQVPLSDMITVLADANNRARVDIANTYFGARQVDDNDLSSSPDNSQNEDDPSGVAAKSSMLVSQLRFQELWAAMAAALPTAWNLPSKLARLPLQCVKHSFAEPVCAVAASLLSRTRECLTHHSFLREAAYSAVRSAYLTSVFRGMTFLLLGHADKPKNADLVELIEIMGGSLTRDEQCPFITAVVDMDAGSSLHSLVMASRKQKQRAKYGSKRAREDHVRDAAASPMGLAAQPVTDEERLEIFVSTFPHAVLCVSLSWVCDSILHQRLVQLGPRSEYVVLRVPTVPTSNPPLPREDTPETQQANPLSSRTIECREPRDRDSSNGQNVTVLVAAMNDESSPASGRPSSGSRKKRCGPQSAVKDPSLQLSTQQLMVPSQASLSSSVFHQNGLE